MNSPSPAPPSAPSAPNPARDPASAPLPQARLSPLGLLGGAVFPGLGHVLNGEASRGVLAGVGVLGLFVGGLLVGGIDVVDAREDRLWFVGQAGVGPLAFGVNALHQANFKAHDPQSGALIDTRKRSDLSTLSRAQVRALLARAPMRSARPTETRDFITLNARDGELRVPVFRPADLSKGEGPPNRKSLAKMNEIGTLSATLAGMINLIVILDAAFPTRRRTTGATGARRDGGGA